MRYRSLFLIAVPILLLDQLTKLWVISNFEPWSSRPVIDGFFNLVYVLNKGAVFGFLNRSDIDWQRGFFIAATLAAFAIIFYLARVAHESDRLFLRGLGLIMGGALGNLVDRARIGHVIDFLDFHVMGWHWPAFNVADIAISTGALLLIISLYVQRKPPQDRKGSNHTASPDFKE